MSRLLPPRREWPAILGSAFLFAVAFPPWPLVIPVFICLAPVACAIARDADADGRAGTAARIGFWFGFIAFGLSVYWIASALSLITTLALAGYLVTIFLHGVVIAASLSTLHIGRRTSRLPMSLLLPVVWVATELAFAHLHDIKFPWLPLGLAMTPYPLWAQFADVSGVHGVSFWIAMVNGAAVDVWMARPAWKRAASGIAIASGATAAVALYGTWRINTLPLQPLARVSVVQPNVPERDRIRPRRPERFIDALSVLTRSELARAPTDLVVWPETALPGHLSFHPEWQDSLQALAGIARTPILFGVLDVVNANSPNARIFNAARVTEPGGRVRQQPYRKIFLVPVVERIPFVNPRWFSGSMFFGQFGRGERTEPLSVPFGKVGVLICYESIFPPLARAYRRRDAVMLVNITNDAWFGRTAAPYQHHAHLVLRAIENRLPVVRSANTGISSYIDPLGRIIGETDLFVQTARTYDVRRTTLESLYVRVGDWIGASCMVLSLALLVMIRRRSRPPAE